MWMEEAKRRLAQEPVPTANLGQILEYLAYSLFKQGNPKHALQLSEELDRLEPNHPRAKGNIKFYEDYLAKEGVKSYDMRRSLGRVVNERPQSVLGNEERTIYEALCRNEVPVSEKDISKLYCYYKRDRPYLVYAPIKVEIKRFNPLAVLFKEIMSDEEIRIVEELALPRLARATVHDSTSGKLVHATYRISKSAWLKGWEHEVLDRLNKRIDMMTNLEMETAEELQTQNYGIGGHYDPHFDHARKEETESFKSLGTGNRVATVLIYHSEPVYGGGTVFTDVKSAIFPTKHDALFWYNLQKTGESDTRTRHAACPVLLGVKWVTNKWIHERGNEFRRPCGLRMSDAERFIGDLGFGPEPRNAPNLSPDLSKNIYDTIK
ncbi:hypothetical protein V3C99_001231 [Haemonchus contortus]